jgi:hypothetical protein
MGRPVIQIVSTITTRATAWVAPTRQGFLLNQQNQRLLTRLYILQGQRDRSCKICLCTQTTLHHSQRASSSFQTQVLQTFL